MAYETPERDRLHLNEDLIYFEFLDKDGKPVCPGEPGRVIVFEIVQVDQIDADSNGKLRTLISEVE